MSKTTLYIATTLDGKIARKDGSLDWLFALANPNQIDHGYADFRKSIGTTIMGKNTYNEILGFGVEWPYKGMDSYIATTDKEFQATTPETYIISSNIADHINKLKVQSQKDIWLIGGGQLITYFLNNDLLDRMILTLIPTIIGEGISLFPDNPKETKWILSNVEKFETGVVNLTYDKE
jgi:dihydrofolate reductase